MNGKLWKLPVRSSVAWAGLILTGCASSGLNSATGSFAREEQVVPSAVRRLSVPASPPAVIAAADAGHRRAAVATDPERLPNADAPEFIVAEMTETAGEVRLAAQAAPEFGASPLVPPPAPATDQNGIPGMALPSPTDDADDVLAEVPPPPPEGAMPLDLASALTLTAGQNPQIAFVQAQIREALAQLQSAEVLWLPSIRVGGNYNKHEGKIQDVGGAVFDTSRIGTYGGLGARGIGAGSPTFPGIVMQFDLADAVFQPRIATRFAQAREQRARATVNDELLDTALAYLNLLDALERQAIARETVENSEELADLTDAFARTGQGTEADADRAATNLAIQRNQLVREAEAVAVGSAQLAQQLSIDPAVLIVPSEPGVAPIHLVPVETPVQELVATALSNRPELAENQFLVAEAIQRLQREKYSPLLPSLFIGMDYGAMGGGFGNHIGNSGDRFDFDAVAFWEVQNLGLGEQAARNQARSVVEQTRFQQVQAMDQVARDVVEARAQVESRQRQIEVAETAVQAALNSYRRNLNRIREGQGLPIEVLQSLLALDQARREYLRAVVGYNESQFRLHRALGWPVR